MTSLAPRVADHVAARHYAGALVELAQIRSEVDLFFDKVLVNAEDASLRKNRLALLTRLESVMNQVADISKLAV
jgi:glycyl-tRNA synthetase beta chain